MSNIRIYSIYKHNNNKMSFNNYQFLYQTKYKKREKVIFNIIGGDKRSSKRLTFNLILKGNIISGDNWLDHSRDYDSKKTF